MASINNLVTRAGNQALEINPPSSSIDIHLTNHGSDWLWAAFSIFALFGVVHAFIFAFTSSKTALRKTLLVIPLFTNVILAYTYFTYASDLGYTSTSTEFKHVTTSEGLSRRQVFYVKYIGWFLAWPFNLFAITVSTNTFRDEVGGNTSGENVTQLIQIASRMFTKFIATEIYVLGLLIGILILSTYKWGYFTFAVSAQLFVMSLISVDLFKGLRSLSVSKPSIFIVLFQLIVWILYPICWGLSEGGNKIQPDSEAVFYGILDVITFSFIPTLLTWLTIRNLDEDFFHSIFRPSTYTEKSSVQTPRHSGDTAVQTPPQTTDAAVSPDV